MEVPSAGRLAGAREAIQRQYQQTDEEWPWIVAYSGGKDSTLLLQLVWEAVLALRPRERQRAVYVVGNDTLVESPLVIGHLRSTLRTIGEAAVAAALPLQTRLTKPHIDQTFWVNVIGRGYIPPTRNFRWCTDRMKIHPTNGLIETLVARHGGAVLLVGTRRAESSSRRQRMDKRGVEAAKLNPHGSIGGCWMFAPIADLGDEDVWMTLMQRKPPWGGTHRDLVTLYRNAGGGECPLVLTKEDAPSCGSTSPRFGCWTCTVVKKDRSLGGLIKSGHADTQTFKRLFDFREWLIGLREDNRNRQRVRRNGFAYFRDDGSRIMGPFRIEVRQIILDRLKELETETGQQFISHAEEELIRDIWRRDRTLEECRVSLHKAVGQPASTSL